jgi:uncharacterized protein
MVDLPASIATLSSNQKREFIVKETLQALLVVQDRDLRIVTRQKEADDIPARKAQILRHLEGAQQAVEAAQEEMKKSTARMREIEGEIEVVKGQVTRHQQQQLQIKSNTEYKALEKEMAREREKIRVLEDRQLERMEQIEADRKVVEERKAALAAEEGHIQEDLDALDERYKNLQGELSKLQEDRKALAAGVDPVSLARYERVFAHWKADAIVGIEDRTCRGCHMNLPPQVIQDVKRGDKLVSCTFCNRFLYLKR